MIAYHNDPTLKADMLAEMQWHREAEKIAQGHYWDETGTGCAVGCAVQSLNLRRGLTLDHSDHAALASAVNWPVRLWYLVDKLFEMQAPEAANRWPERVLNAVPVGADLTHAVDLWLIDLLDHIPPQTRPDVVASIAGVKELLTRRVNGDEPTREEWRAKRSAAYAAADAAAAYAAADAYGALSALSSKRKELADLIRKQLIIPTE